jgi:hypothetical protein
MMNSTQPFMIGPPSFLEKDYVGLSDQVMLKLRNICEKSIDENRNLDLEELNSIGVDYESAYSLRTQIYSQRVRKSSSKVRNQFEKGPQYLKMWQTGGHGNDILSLARHAR